MTSRVRSRFQGRQPGAIGTGYAWPNYVATDILDFGTDDYESCLDTLNKHDGRHWVTGGLLDLSRSWGTYSNASMIGGASLPFGALYEKGTACISPPVHGAFNGASWAKGQEELDLDSYGASALNRFRPGKPTVSLGVAIGEMRDAPQLMLRKLKDLQSAGSNYLAVQFGWKPFLRDLFDLMKSMADLDKSIDNFQKQFGTTIRRSGKVESISEDLGSESKVPTLRPSFGTALKSLSGSRHHTCKKTIWFSGKFEFPPIKDNRWSPLPGVIQQMYGLSLTPDVVWNLVPWTWLVDWGVNVGDGIANGTALAVDKMFIHYAYLMGTYEYTTEDSFSATVKFWDKPPTYPINGSAATRSHRKLRVVADPFALRFTADEINSYQLSILVALGLSRS